MKRFYYNSFGEMSSESIYPTSLFQYLSDESYVGRITEREVETVTIKYKNGETFVYLLEA